jgi:hypothetical protein
MGQNPLSEAKSRSVGPDGKRRFIIMFKRPYSESDEYSLKSHILFLYDPLKYYPSIYD